MLVSSHDLSELEQVCDWLVLIEAGRIVYQGRTVDFVGTAVAGLAVAPEHPSDLDVLGAVLRSAGHEVHEHDGRLVVDDVDDGRALAAAVNRAAHDAGIVLVELSPLRTSLEDRYLALVRRARRRAADDPHHPCRAAAPAAPSDPARHRGGGVAFAAVATLAVFASAAGAGRRPAAAARPSPAWPPPAAAPRRSPSAPRSSASSSS